MRYISVLKLRPLLRSFGATYLLCRLIEYIASLLTGALGVEVIIIKGFTYVPLQVETLHQITMSVVLDLNELPLSLVQFMARLVLFLGAVRAKEVDETHAGGSCGFIHSLH